MVRNPQQGASANTPRAIDRCTHTIHLLCIVIAVNVEVIKFKEEKKHRDVSRLTEGLRLPIIIIIIIIVINCNNN